MKKSELTGVKIEVSIDCTNLLDKDIDVLAEFGKLGDEVVYYDHVTVSKYVSDVYMYHLLLEEIRELKEAMDNTYKRLVEACDANAMS